MPPDTPAGPAVDTGAGERRALETAVAEAWASVEAGRVTPHAEVRAELLEFIRPRASAIRGVGRASAAVADGGRRLVGRGARRPRRHPRPAFLLERNPVAALRMAEAPVLAADSLATFLDRGRPGLVPGTWEPVAVRPRVIVLGIRRGRVAVLRVWHGARDRA